MIYKFLAIPAMMPGCYCTFRMLDMVVPVKHPVRLSLTGAALSCMLWGINNMVLPRPNVMLELLTGLANILVILVLLPRKDFFKATLVQLAFQGTQTVTVMIVLLVVKGLLGGDFAAIITAGNPKHVCMCLIASLLTFPAVYGVARLLRRLLPAIRSGARYAWFLIIPFTQVALLNLASRPALDVGEYAGYKLTLVYCIFLSMAADIACIFTYRKLRQMERMELTAAQSEKALEAQVAYYQELQEQILAVNRIRHDLNNQLQAARYLLEKGNTAEVYGQLDRLQSAIREHVGSRFSDNPVVDAVVSVKAEQCARQGISLETGILLPGNLKIENVHLCSIFSNLLDNSIHGIQEAGCENAVIRLRSDVHGDFLTVSCVNPAVQPKKKASGDVLRRHGLGLDILEHIARIYDGRLESGFQDGSYSTVVILKNPE